MAQTEINASEHKVFPEMIWATNGQNLAEGVGNLFKIKSIPPNQVIAPLKYAVESVASITSQFFFDNIEKSKAMPDDALGGIAISNDLSPHPAHEMGYAFKEFRWEANNSSGSSSTDHRSRLQYLVDARTTTRRIIERINNLGDFDIRPDEDPTPVMEQIRKLNSEIVSKRDINAVKILWQERKINTLALLLNGNSVPPLWEDFLKIHEVVATHQNAIKKTLTSSFSDTQLLDFNVPEGRVATLEGTSFDVSAQAKVGEATAAITRDEDLRFLEFDPACMGTDQKHYPWHIHAFDHLEIDLKTTGTETDYKAWAGVTIRQPGAAFKAKMEEFSPGILPSALEPTEAEERIIEELHLREIARCGIVAIG